MDQLKIKLSSKNKLSSKIKLSSKNKLSSEQLFLFLNSPVVIFVHVFSSLFIPAHLLFFTRQDFQPP